ncbi:MAG: glycosyltransferase, partial [Myxococcales bacterium]|nr:glycosyltransferase [Myxococcales bacterium]
MPSQPIMPTVALVLETNNLRGGDAPRVAESLARLLAHLRAQSFALEGLDQIVVTHDGLSEGQRRTLRLAAARSLTFVRLPPGTDYYAAKNLGFAATTAEVVVFGDSDCWPDRQWLSALVAPFGDPGVQVVAGRTSYRADVLGAALTSIDFMYFPSAHGPECRRNFYANNVAFRREIFERRRFPVHERIYRGPCQLLGMQLHEEGVGVRYEAQAHTVHRLPDDMAELVRLRLLRGQDSAELTPRLVEHVLPSAPWLGRMGPLSPALVLLTRLGFSLRALGHLPGPALRG